ncbi:MAG TPA: diiron oxygenase [Candidatus Angelobacter sp.]
MSVASAAFVLEATSVDYSRPFIPERFTPLSYTESYQELTETQKLRYNQLHGLYFNEQIMFFEAALGQTLLEALLRQPWPAALEEGLRRLREEERRHTEMFRQLNRLGAPHIYAARDFYFVQMPKLWKGISDWAARHPLYFPLFVWLMLLQEERSLYYSREFVRQRGLLEPHFVETQRRHMADEAKHVRLDEAMIDALWAHATPSLRKINARLFAWMLREFFNTPRRAQLRVVEELVREFPGLRPRRREMRRQMLALSRDAEYQTSLYSRAIVPRTFSRFDDCPEFKRLRIPGYCRLAKEAS